MSAPKIRMTCPECGVVFTQKHHRAQFCTPAHSKAYNNRQLAEGQRIVAMAKAWRMGRNQSDPALKESAKEAFSQMCRELDALNLADKNAGRVSALKMFARRMRAGLLDFQGVLSR